MAKRVDGKVLLLLHDLGGIVLLYLPVLLELKKVA